MNKEQMLFQNYFPIICNIFQEVFSMSNAKFPLSYQFIDDSNMENKILLSYGTDKKIPLMHIIMNSELDKTVMHFSNIPLSPIHIELSQIEWTENENILNCKAYFTNCDFLELSFQKKEETIPYQQKTVARYIEIPYLEVKLLQINKLLKNKYRTNCLNQEILYLKNMKSNMERVKAIYHKETMNEKDYYVKRFK